MGTFHLPASRDEVNLSFRADGTLRWRILGCDYIGTGDGSYVGLEALQGQSGAPLLWPLEGPTDVDTGLFRYDVRATATTGTNGELLLSGSSVFDRVDPATNRRYKDRLSFSQVWLPGRRCAVYGADHCPWADHFESCADQSPL